MKKEEHISIKIVEEMRQAGLSYGQMLKVIRLIQKRFEKLRKINKYGIQKKSEDESRSS